MENRTWDQAGRNWLQEESNKAFQVWRQSKQGRKWDQSKNPYKMGFSLPDWHHKAMEYLNKGDEASFKALKIYVITGNHSNHDIYVF